MVMVITVKVSADGPDTTAPTAGDLLDQLRDYLEVLSEVEKAIAGDGQSVIEWRAVNAFKENPLGHAFSPFPRHYATNIDERVEIVAGVTAHGIKSLMERADRPRGFTDQAVKKLRQTFQRVTNGLNLSEISFGEGLPVTRVVPATAYSAMRNADAVLSPVDKPYSELGTVDGICEGTQRDGHGRPLLNIRVRLTGESVKCILSDDALEEFERHQVKDVLEGRRVLVRGIVQFKALGQIGQVRADNVEFMRSKSELPTLEQILDEDFTRGLRTEDYLDKLRNGEIT